jgi:hypothetical protein
MLASGGANASNRQLIVMLTFKRYIEAFPIFQLIDVSVPDENNSCSVFQMVVNGHNTFVESTSFNDAFFQLVVDSKLILNSEGALAVTITSYSVYEGAQRHSSCDATGTNVINFGKGVNHRVDEKMNSESITLATILFNKQTYL